ncbi:MAG: 2-oxoacid:ferredoxin oxidoreductase subunit beta [Prolixibacteraceae bacterium]|jgi:2-oxoglutarate ferredoxin oxidoreductase subunit beta|nr:2-oxoacid:ferredoxin oxidoreductase subunit beta [Prolixibacteraceae bacterium]
MREFTYTAKDFKSANEVRWCPGCGDHAIMNAIQRVMANLGLNKADYAVISGIGCSSRFPYYMNTFGFHTIHGRGAAIASGVKSANPKLHVWQITGDGDAMAIGGNHFIHTIRRNIDMNLVLFNNKIYGLTKGQYSPTTDFGSKTKTSPYGTIEEPFVPGQLVLGAKGAYYARAIDGNMKMSQEIFDNAARHKGTSVVEVLQNCVIFSGGIHDEITKGEDREDKQIYLKHGEKMIFGTNKDKGLVLENGKLKSVTIGQDGFTLDDILVHDAKEESLYMHAALINMQMPEMPVAFGVIRAVEATPYDVAMEEQIAEVQKTRKIKCVDDLLRSGNTWEV